MDPNRGERRDVHAVARHHRRQHGAPVDSEGPVGELHRPAMGDRCVHALARRGRAHGRIDRRPCRPPCRIRHRAGDLRRCVARRRPRAGRDGSEHRPRHPGYRRGGDVRRVPRPRRAGVRARTRACHGDGCLRRDDRGRRRRRPARRRSDHHGARVALGVLHQRPDRPAGDRGDVRAPTGIAGSERDPGGLARTGHLQLRTGDARARAAPRQRRRLGERDDPRAVRRRCGDARGVHGGRAPRRRADAPARPVPQPGVHRRAARGVRRVRVAVRSVPVPHPVSAELPRLLAAAGRAAVPADHAGAVLRRAARRLDDGPAPGPCRDGDRARRRRWRAAAHVGTDRRLRLDRTAAGVPRSPASASASSIRSSPMWR